MKYSAQEITAALGGRWHGQYGTARCPVHDDKTASLKISEKRGKDGKGRLDCHCFAGCDWKDVKAELVKRGLVEPFRPGSLASKHEIARQIAVERLVAQGKTATLRQAHAEADDAKRVSYALRLWKQCVPLEGTAGGAYLRVHRGLNFVDGQFDHCLRWHANKNMIVARVGTPSGDIFCGVQRILLDELGRKIDRRQLGKWGVCRLSDDHEVGEGLFITEGIEDGIASLSAGRGPVWACVCTGMIEKFPVLGGIDALTILSDTDDAGTKAAASCAARWMAAEKEVRILQITPRPA